MMLTMSMSDWLKISKTYGHEVKLKDFDNYAENLVKLIYQKMYGEEAPKSRMDNFSDFGTLDKLH